MCNIHYFLFTDLIDLPSAIIFFLRTSHCYEIMKHKIGPIFWLSKKIEIILGLTFGQNNQTSLHQ